MADDKLSESALQEIRERLASYKEYYPSDADLWPTALRQSISNNAALLRHIRAQDEELKEAAELVALYQDEGEAQVPEEDEYRKLASMPPAERTKEESQRLRFLAGEIVRLCDAKLLRAQVCDLQSQLSAAEKERERLRQVVNTPPNERVVCDCHTWPTIAEMHDYVVALEIRLGEPNRRAEQVAMEGIKQGLQLRDANAVEAFRAKLVEALDNNERLLSDALRETRGERLQVNVRLQLGLLRDIRKLIESTEVG